MGFEASRSQRVTGRWVSKRGHRGLQGDGGVLRKVTKGFEGRFETRSQRVIDQWVSKIVGHRGLHGDGFLTEGYREMEADEHRSSRQKGIVARA